MRIGAGRCPAVTQVEHGGALVAVAALLVEGPLLHPPRAAAAIRVEPITKSVFVPLIVRRTATADELAAEDEPLHSATTMRFKRHMERANIYSKANDDGHFPSQTNGSLKNAKGLMFEIMGVGCGMCLMRCKKDAIMTCASFCYMAI
jgi:hypothetical protein